MSLVRDILSGKVKWRRKIGWCDEPFLFVELHAVAEPTVEQIRFIQTKRYADKNYLQIRKLLQEGGRIGFGIMLPEDVEKLDVQLSKLGLPYSTSKEKIYRPRKPL